MRAGKKLTYKWLSYKKLGNIQKKYVEKNLNQTKDLASKLNYKGKV